jgi:hypothetical protein
MDHWFLVCVWLALRYEGTLEPSLGSTFERTIPPKPEISDDDIKQMILTTLKMTGYARAGLTLLMLVIGLTLGDVFLNNVKFEYVNSADVHYHQVLRLASPYLDAHELAEIESDFAELGSREDYVKLLSRLESLCKAHGRRVPQFDPW